MSDHALCEKLVQKHLRESPLVVFLLDAIKAAGCPMRPESFKCVPCRETDGSGLYDLESNTIRICEDAVQSSGHVQDTMAHELIHAFDVCRVEFDPQDCRQRACSEIRAANLSGDCKWSREAMRGHWQTFKGQHRICVRRRAILSLTGCEACRDQDVERVVDQVFESCISDTEPFIDTP